MTKKPLRKIELEQLEVGMYVTKLDISWMDSPFLSHSRKIGSIKDISLLKKAGVKILTIDPNKGQDATETQPHETAKRQNTPETKDVANENRLPDQSVPKKTKEKVLAEEINSALEIRSQVKKAIINIHRDLNSGGLFNSNEVYPLIENTLDSLERYHHALFNLAHISKRNQKIADHTFSTFCITLSLGKKCSLSDEEIEALGVAALVHEVGWSHIPVSLMGKRMQYTNAEIKLIQQHSKTSLKAIEKCDISRVSKRIVAEHHELCDGSGYPNQLKSEQIHPLTKMLSVVDRYDELVNQLNDKPGMLPTNALRHLYLCAQKKIYDAECVSALISLLGVYPVSSAVELSNGALGVVREVPLDNNLKPLVEIRVDPQNQRLDIPYYIDLACDQSQENSVSITRVIDPTDSKEPYHRSLTLDI